MLFNVALGMLPLTAPAKFRLVSTLSSSLHTALWISWFSGVVFATSASRRCFWAMFLLSVLLNSLFIGHLSDPEEWPSLWT